MGTLLSAGPHEYPPSKASHHFPELTYPQNASCHRATVIKKPPEDVHVLSGPEIACAPCSPAVRGCKRTRMSLSL